MISKSKVSGSTGTNSQEVSKFIISITPKEKTGRNLHADPSGKNADDSVMNVSAWHDDQISNMNETSTSAGKHDIVSNNTFTIKPYCNSTERVELMDDKDEDTGLQKELHISDENISKSNDSIFINATAQTNITDSGSGDTTNLTSTVEGKSTTKENNAILNNSNSTDLIRGSTMNISINTDDSSKNIPETPYVDNEHNAERVASQRTDASTVELESSSTNATNTMIQTQSEASDKTITLDTSLDAVHNSSAGPEAFLQTVSNAENGARKNLNNEPTSSSSCAELSCEKGM